jgi:hypothetical protein
MSARHRNPSGELTAPPVDQVRPGRARRTPSPIETGASQGATTPPVQRRAASSRLTTDPRGTARTRGTAGTRTATDPRGNATAQGAAASQGTATYRGMTDPRGTTTSRGTTTPRGISALRGVPRPPAPSTRSPLLLRVTLATALVAAVGTSMMRAHVDFGAVADNALRLMPVTHTSDAGTPQVVHLVPAGSHPGRRAASTSASQAEVVPAVAAAARPKTVQKAAAQAAPGAHCQVTYVLTPQPDGRSSVVVTVNNLGAAPIDGWVVRWPAAADQQLALGWGAGLAHAGVDAIATDAGFNRLIPVKGRVSFGFSGWNLAASPSTAFRVNGVMCK